MTVAVKSPELTGAARCSYLWAEPEVNTKGTAKERGRKDRLWASVLCSPSICGRCGGSRPSGSELTNVPTVGFLTPLAALPKSSVLVRDQIGN